MSQRCSASLAVTASVEVWEEAEFPVPSFTVKVNVARIDAVGVCGWCHITSLG